MLLRVRWAPPGQVRTVEPETRSVRTSASPCRRRSARPSTASSAAPSLTTSARLCTRIREAFRVELTINVGHWHWPQTGPAGHSLTFVFHCQSLSEWTLVILRSILSFFLLWIIPHSVRQSTPRSVGQRWEIVNISSQQLIFPPQYDEKCDTVYEDKCSTQYITVNEQVRPSEKLFFANLQQVSSVTRSFNS